MIFDWADPRCRFHLAALPITIEAMRVLIVKLGSIGDILHTLPSLAAIRRGLPDAEISWLVETRVADILRGNPLIDNLIEADTRSMRGGKVIEGILLDAGRQVNELRQFTFDTAVDFQGLMKSALMARLSGAKVRYGFSKSGLREGAARLFYTHTADVPAGLHVIKKNLALAAAALDITVPHESFEFPVATSDENRLAADVICKTVGGEFAVLNPAGGWVTKLWPADSFGQLADRLWEEKGIASIVATGPNETELGEIVATSARRAPVVVAQPALKDLYELLKRARVYVGGDTGPTHVAVAAGAPVVGLFGPTEWWRNGSLDPDDICVERNDIDCRVDCHRRTCGKWICMDSDVDTVFAAVTERLSRVRSSTGIGV